MALLNTLFKVCYSYFKRLVGSNKTFYKLCLFSFDFFSVLNF